MNDSLRVAGSSRKSRVRHFLLILIAILAVWTVAGFLATIPVAGKHPYWRTLRARPLDFGLKAEDASFSSTDGIPLKGCYIRSQGTSLGTLIIAHGINGKRSDMLSRAAFLVRDNYNTLLIDLRDHGESGGTYAGPGYMESCDILGALKYLQSRGETEPITVMGHSFGAVAALYAAGQSLDIAAVISDCAFISFEDIVNRATTLLAKDPKRSFWERMGLGAAGFRVTGWAVKPIYYLRTGVWLQSRKADSLVAISRIGMRPVLFISGERDEICPPQNARRMYNVALSPEKLLLVVPNAEHDTTYSTEPQLYESTVVDFLQKAFQRAALVGESKICLACK